MHFTSLASALSSSSTRIATSFVALALVIAGCASDAPDSTAASETTIADITVDDLVELDADASSESEVSETVAEQDEPDAAMEADSGSDGDTTDDTADPADTAATESAEQPADDSTEPSDDPNGAAATGVITDIVADATGGRSTFDGEVDELADLDALVVDAWGDGGLGLHRGHAQVENVLEAFLGIDHDTMHAYMDDGFNLGDLAVELGRDADDLVETLTASYAPYVNEGVENGVITDAEAAEWIELLRTEFTDRVYWDGVSAS